MLGFLIWTEEVLKSLRQQIQPLWDLLNMISIEIPPLISLNFWERLFLTYYQSFGHLGRSMVQALVSPSPFC